MATVIARPQPNEMVSPGSEAWMYRFACAGPACRAVLRVDASDVRTKVDRTGLGGDSWHYVVCPACRRPNTVHPPDKN
jgi:hypothetical protein